MDYLNMNYLKDIDILYKKLIDNYKLFNLDYVNTYNLIEFNKSCLSSKYEDLCVYIEYYLLGYYKNKIVNMYDLFLIKKEIDKVNKNFNILDDIQKKVQEEILLSDNIHKQFKFFSKMIDIKYIKKDIDLINLLFDILIKNIIEYHKNI